MNDSDWEQVYWDSVERDMLRQAYRDAEAEDQREADELNVDGIIWAFLEDRLSEHGARFLLSEVLSYDAFDRRALKLIEQRG